MESPNAIIGLLAHTSIHAGSGQNTGVIDLSIQREGHNGWPCIFGSAVKGAVRTCAVDKGCSDGDISLIFGSNPNENDVHAGSVAFSDARLLLFPVRSLTSHFKWVTCLAALKRYIKDLVRMGINNKVDLPDFDLNNETALVTDKHQSGNLFLEEYRFKTQSEEKRLQQVVNILKELMREEDAGNLINQLVIVSDDMFSFLVQHATPVNAHIAIETETKIVKPGALWYEETLPPETLLYFTLSAVKARQDGETKRAEDMCNSVIQLFASEHGKWLQLGGNETVGMGWCAVKPYKIGTKSCKPCNS